MLLVQEHPLCSYVVVLKRGQSVSMSIYRDCGVRDELILIVLGSVEVLDCRSLKGGYNLRDPHGVRDS